MTKDHPPQFEIVEVVQVNDELVAAFERLSKQLSQQSQSPSRAHLHKIVSSSACVLYVARYPVPNGTIVGGLTLILFPIPTGVRARIEDVVVDVQTRGRGIGRALCQAAVDRAVTAGAASIELTSNPSRRAANRLYARLGFQLRQTNVYRYRLGT